MTEKSFEMESFDININNTIFNDDQFKKFFNKSTSNSQSEMSSYNTLLFNQFQPFITAFPLQDDEPTSSDIEEEPNEETIKTIPSIESNAFLNPMFIETFQPSIGGILHDSSYSSDKKDQPSKVSNEMDDEASSSNNNDLFSDYLNFNNFYNYHQSTLNFNSFSSFNNPFVSSKTF